MTTTNNGWPVVASAAVTRVYLAADRDGVLVLRGDVERALSWLVREIHTRVEPVTVVNGWRSAADNARFGGAAGSNHMSGTAIDVNGGQHPYELHLPASQRGTRYRSGWTAAQVAAIRSILARADGLFAWGLDYPSGFRDAMHFDIAKGRTPADVARFVAAVTTPPAPEPVRGEDDETMRLYIWGRSKYRLLTGDRVTGLTREGWEAFKASGVPVVVLPLVDCENLEKRLIAESVLDDPS